MSHLPASMPHLSHQPLNALRMVKGVVPTGAVPKREIGRSMNLPITSPRGYRSEGYIIYIDGILLYFILL